MGAHEEGYDPEDVRFGRLAISFGFVMPEDVLEAFELQGTAAALGQHLRVAQVLVRRGKLSLQNVVAISKGTVQPDSERPPAPETQLSLPPRARAPKPESARMEKTKTPHLPSFVAMSQHLSVANPSVESVSGSDGTSFSLDTSERGTLELRPPTPAQGMKVGMWLGPYQLLEEIGRGGMGIVFKARREPWGEYTAVKVLRDPNRRSLKERFIRETQIVASLEHPNIVKIRDTGVASEIPFFAMELIEGKGLNDLIGSGELDARSAAAILRDVARAVDYAHRSGVVHRDLKPANVIVALDGTPKVTDFGLAKVDDDGRHLTRTGAPIGTPAYMSPEQALGEELDHRTDIFSLGVMLFESVSRKLPFAGVNIAALEANDTELPVPRMKKGDAKLEAIFRKACARRPEERYETAEALALDLDAWLDGRSPKAWHAVRIRLVPRRTVELVGAGISGALCVLFFVAAALEVRDRMSRAAPPPLARLAPPAPAANPPPPLAGEGRGGGPSQAPAPNPPPPPASGRHEAATPAPAPNPPPPLAGEGRGGGRSPAPAANPPPPLAGEGRGGGPPPTLVAAPVASASPVAAPRPVAPVAVARPAIEEPKAPVPQPDAPRPRSVISITDSAENEAILKARTNREAASKVVTEARVVAVETGVAASKPAVSQEDAERPEAELNRIRAGRKALAAALVGQRLPLEKGAAEVLAFDDAALALTVKGQSEKLALVHVPAKCLLALVTAPADRAFVAHYLLARGLGALPLALAEQAGEAGKPLLERARLATAAESRDSLVRRYGR